MWWQHAVIYQIYPRSFQDSDGDGVGDLPGICSRLDHVQDLGATAIWLSPFYRSPGADFGYDVSDYTAVDPLYGTLAEFDELVRAAHARDLRVLVDLIPCHTSTQHRWFRERPDFYFWADAPPNNWLATFGGSAWERDPVTGRYYLHSFFPEQADLNWRNRHVPQEMGKVIKFWLQRGVDGFRVDAIDHLLKDAELRDDPPATERFPLPLGEEYAALRHAHSANAPDIGDALRSLRHAARDAFLVGEVYLPTAALEPYLTTLDIAFAFEAMNAGPSAQRLKSAITAAAATGKIGWILSNHDFERFATRFGPNLRAAALLFLSLPGPVFMLHGDEIGMVDGPGAEPPLDRAGRDSFRHPMQWDSSAFGGFTTGTPWLPLIDPQSRNVAEQEADPDSLLHLFRRLIGLRSGLDPSVTFRDSPADTLILERADLLVAVNLADAPVAIKREGELVLEAHPGDAEDRALVPPHGGWIARR